MTNRPPTHGIPVTGFRGPCPCDLEPCGGVVRLSRLCAHHNKRRPPTMEWHPADSDRCRAIAQTPVPPPPAEPSPGELRQVRVFGPDGDVTTALVALQPPSIGLPPWDTVTPGTRAGLIECVPARLQRLMYTTDEDIPDDEFAQDVAEADRRLAELVAADAEAALVFEGLTFAGVAHAPSPEAAAEHEYYLCDALITYASDRYDGIWSAEFPVLDQAWLHRYRQS
ncbi:hypothetical protein ACFQ61_10130 [Streptomyces sp. NPDC056500]|uniref:hypothetical protein n=1 Tax=Streptomyces sp. NPDC056500 TaxID=3345840 RepID=UPI003694BC17